MNSLPQKLNHYKSQFNLMLTLTLIIFAVLSFAAHPQPARYTSPKFVAASYRVVEREAPRTVLVNFQDGVTLVLEV